MEERKRLKIGAQATGDLLQDLIDFASLHIFLDQTADSLEFFVFGVLDELEQHGLGSSNGGTSRSHTLRWILVKRICAIFHSSSTYCKCNVDFCMVLRGDTVGEDMDVNVVF